MKKHFLNFIFLILFSTILTGCSILPSRKKAALYITTTPKATIFLDGKHLGQTPYNNDKLKKGEYVLKIVPESSGQALAPWESRISLIPGIRTIVNRDMKLTQEESSGEILSFEPLADKNTSSISIVTTPDGAVITLDGEPRGFAPVSINDVSEGEHILSIESTGYIKKDITVKTVNGYKLIASIKLARKTIEKEPEKQATESAKIKEDPETEDSSISSPVPKPTPKTSPSTQATDEEIERPYVEITSEVGWANVRSEASAAKGEETVLTQVDAGEKFPLLDTTENGWYQIEYETGKNGWIAGTLAEKYE